MGRLFLMHLDGNVYSCKHCKIHPGVASDIISKAFHCKHGKAYLFHKNPTAISGAIVTAECTDTELPLGDLEGLLLQIANDQDMIELQSDHSAPIPDHNFNQAVLTVLTELHHALHMQMELETFAEKENCFQPRSIIRGALTIGFPCWKYTDQKHAAADWTNKFSMQWCLRIRAVTLPMVPQQGYNPSLKLG